ncbi:hypothetical protein F4703DRAFT_1798918 [Phycomyces blakesleeanus]
MSSIQKTDYLNLHPIPANNINKTIKDTLHQLHTNTPYTPRAYFQITLLYSVLDPDYHISIAMKNLESNPLPNIRITLQTVDISLFLLNSCMYILASISILFLPFFFSDSRKIFTIMPTNQSNNTLLCWSVFWFDLCNTSTFMLNSLDIGVTRRVKKKDYLAKNNSGTVGYFLEMFPEKDEWRQRC